MKKILLLLLVSLSSCALFAEAYVGGGWALTLPQGGSRLSNACGGAVRGGYYVGDATALEGEVGVLENECSLAVQAIFHARAWETYDRFFGYSPFDPFLTLGGRGWIGRHDGQVGPKAGIGFFYHLTECVSLRADADVTLGLDTDVETLYSITVGAQYEF